jgi:hypothetical protein
VVIVFRVLLKLNKVNTEWAKCSALSGSAGSRDGSLPAACGWVGELPSAAGSQRDQTVPTSVERVLKCGELLLSRGATFWRIMLMHFEVLTASDGKRAPSIRNVLLRLRVLREWRVGKKKRASEKAGTAAEKRKDGHVLHAPLAPRPRPMVSFSR